ARDACRFGDGHNALRVAAVEPRPARIHKHRLAGRSDKERGLPAFYVNEVHVEGARRPQRRAEKCQESNQEEFAHGVNPITERWPSEYGTGVNVAGTADFGVLKNHISGR